MKIVENTHLRYDTIVAVPKLNNHKLFEKEKSLIIFDSGFSGTSNNSGWFCLICKRIFIKFRDYDFHLNKHIKCAKDLDPVEIQVELVF